MGSVVFLRPTALLVSAGSLCACAALVPLLPVRICRSGEKFVGFLSYRQVRELGITTRLRVASSFGESGFIVAQAEAGSLGPPSGPGGTPQCPGLAWTLALGRWVRCSQFGSGRLQRRWSWDPLGAGVWSVWGANTRPRLHLTGERWVDKRWSPWPSVSRCAGQLCSGTRETWSVPAVPHVLWAGELTWSRVR